MKSNKLLACLSHAAEIACAHTLLTTIFLLPENINS